jgi:GT2 family glycosyltransferase
VRVVTVNYDGGPLTIRCIERLRATAWADDRLEIVLVDNASHDGVADEVERRWSDVRVVRSGVNRGFAGGTNLGIGDLADVDYVALVNNDVDAPPDWLEPLVGALEADSHLGAACPKILFASRFLDVELASTTMVPGRGDHREVGAHVVGAEIVDASGERSDVLGSVQWWRGFWGPEPGSDERDMTQWTTAQAVLRVPTPVGAPTPPKVRLCVVGRRAGSLELRTGSSRLEAELTTTPTWHELDVTTEPFDVVNNAGSILTSSGYGADRGYLEPDDGRYDDLTEVFAWCGAAVVLSARYLADVGLLDDRLFLYSEDLELAWRGRERGWRYAYVPESVVRHVHSATTGEHSHLARFQNERNHLLVLARHAAWPTHCAPPASRCSSRRRTRAVTS